MGSYDAKESANLQEYGLVEASIKDLGALLSNGSITAVELVSRLLQRISKYDCRGDALNAVPILNSNVFEEAAASDERRAQGRSLGPLDGIPYTVKDSYKVKGMTVASGSPAFQDLVSNEDAFTVRKLREAGAVLIGKTNMPPVAAGGMQRGIYGRAESPYNLSYLAAAFASGSSNGSGVSTAASFGAFGMGEETVSSGRSPASNNGLVAYTPSRGGISVRGNWPLYPTCDVIVPHTRSMDDLFILLDTIAATDTTTTGDFWRDQPFIKIESPWTSKPKSFSDLSGNASVKGLRIAVPEMYIGGANSSKAEPVQISPSVIALWQRARADLERLGATVIPISSFPLIEQYETPNSSSPTQSPETPRLPKDWNATERSVLIAHAWNDFLHFNGDPSIRFLADVSHSDIWPPHPPNDPQIAYSEPANKIHYDKLASLITRDPSDTSMTSSIYTVPNISHALHALESMRKSLFEDWMTTNNFDAVVFPAAGDVGRADADVSHPSAEHAWKNGVKYSNGNRALRHVGIPTITVPMGVMEDTGMPVGLTFCGRGGADLEVLKWGKAYEEGTKRRVKPGLVPELESDIVRRKAGDSTATKTAPKIVLEKCVSTAASTAAMVDIQFEGYLTIEDSETNPSTPLLEILVDATPVPNELVQISKCVYPSPSASGSVFTFKCSISVPAPPVQNERNKVASRRKIARDSTMVVVTARVEGGRPSGVLRLL